MGEQAFRAEVEVFQKLERDLETQRQNLQTLIASKNETQLVLDELTGLEDEDEVFKLVGPVLVPQDLDEARNNVNKRLSHIDGQIEAIEERMETMRASSKRSQEKLQRMQMEAQRAGQNRQ